MSKIGGNIEGVFQIKVTETDSYGNTLKNGIGEAVTRWAEVNALNGWLSLQSGNSEYNSFNAKVEESTHVFLCDFDERLYSLSIPDESGVYNVRAIFKGAVYDVLLIDNPDERNAQLEIYLRKVGAWRG